MGDVTYTNESLRLLRAFQALTKVAAVDVIEDEDPQAGKRYVFLVEEGNLARAMGDRGATLVKLRESLGKEVHVIELAKDTERLLRRIFHHVKVLKVQLERWEPAHADAGAEGSAGAEGANDGPRSAPTEGTAPARHDAAQLTATVTVDPDQKGRAIGKGGRNINLAREILRRHRPDIRRLAVE